MNIKKGDNVIVISGKDKGKSGVVSRALPKHSLVVVPGVNFVKRHQRSRRRGEKGQVIEKPMPVHVSNVMLIDPDTKRPTRVGRKRVGEKWVRVSRKSGKEV